METEATIVRIYLHEADHGRRKTLMREILDILHAQHRVQRVTVFRGIAGFDGSAEHHLADLLRVMVDLPLVIEFIDEPPVVETVLGAIHGLVPEGRIVSWQVTRR
jgi:uncharacterized protein